MIIAPNGANYSSVFARGVILDWGIFFNPVEAQCARRHAVCVNAFGVDMPQTRFASLNDHVGFAHMVICAFRVVFL